MGTDVVVAILKEANLKGTINIYPWARALTMAQQQENTLIYCISRTKKRENLYTWVGVIAPIDFYIYSLKNRMDIQINKLEDAKKYSIGIVRDDALDEFFVSNKFQRLQRVSLNEINMKKLILKRFDLWPISEFTANYLLKKNGYNPPKTVKKVFHIEGFADGDQYLAISKITSKEIKDQIRNALKRIKQKGIYQEILLKYQ
ncbi:MAG: transporter substrate-binding domain-containing protein [Desulfobacterales bacterium]|nr:transporter substrate-binding domain-containing protein [Desulfobacterales bacterium]